MKGASENKILQDCRLEIINIYRMPQELRSLLRDLIPELILGQKGHIHMGLIRSGSGVMSF